MELVATHNYVRPMYQVEVNNCARDFYQMKEKHSTERLLCNRGGGTASTTYPAVGQHPIITMHSCCETI